MSNSFLTRFWQYQSERFPFLVHGLLIAVFSFSAIAYSRICRGQTNFIDWPTYGATVFCTVTLFLLVRIFDEHKDAEDDAQFRPELPVPRGLISLKELRMVGFVVFAAQLLLVGLFFTKMLFPLALVLGYLCLMGVEFFIPNWLRKHQFWYVTSHMLIIPLVDIFASGFDWYLGSYMPPEGLVFFFVVSYFNGIVLEVGRKIRSKETEAPGVLTYTGMLGIPAALGLWLLVLFITWMAALKAVHFARLGAETNVFLGIMFGLCSLPALLFLIKPESKRAKWIEYASALWTLVMYGSLGGIPMLRSLLFG
ncbi:MAG: UbiA family prenyltransferase [Bacteroidetes bacterium]|nr:UbiA family prenyltransferase [Bacteroidota bacterium]